MNLLQWSSSLENKGSFRVIYIFKLWMFSSFKLVSSKLLRSSRLHSEQRVNVSRFSTHRAVVNDRITEVAQSAEGSEYQNCLSRLSEFHFLLIILFCFLLFFLSSSYNSVLFFGTAHSATLLEVREFFLLLRLLFSSVNILSLFLL